MFATMSVPTEGLPILPLAWIGAALLVGVLARSRGRSLVAGFVLSLIFSPLLVGICYILSRPAPMICRFCGRRVQ